MDNTQPEHTPHLPRYRREEQRAIPVSIQPRDLLLLKAIYDYPYCTAAQISRLMPIGPINPQLRAYHDQRLLTGVKEHDKTQRPFQVRFHAAGGPYVQRHKVDNNSAILYTIGPRAVDLLAAEFDLDTAALTRSARNRDPGEKFLRHARLRTNVRFAFTIAIGAREDVEIAFWLKDGAVKIPITYATDGGTIVNDTIIPDDFLGVRWIKTGIIDLFFAESDKRKDYPRVRKKFIAYVHLLRQIKKGTAKLPLLPAHVLRELRALGQVRPAQRVYTIADQPITNYRVLWIAKGAERKAGLRRLARGLDGPQGEASGLFWFTHEFEYADHPERILEPVWQKARNDDWRQLLSETTP
jgi:hypothetical protein